MARMTFETVVPAAIEVVWGYHQNVMRGLKELSPPDAGVEILEVDLPLGVGSRVVMEVTGPRGKRVRWVAKYVEFVPPKAVVFGAEGRWVDEQEEGPFKQWRHAHEFEALGDQSTRIVDVVEYKVGWGPVGWVADRAYVRRKVKRMFGHRHAVLAKVFEAKGTGAKGGTRPVANQ